MSSRNGNGIEQRVVGFQTGLFWSQNSADWNSKLWQRMLAAWDGRRPSVQVTSVDGPHYVVVTIWRGGMMFRIGEGTNEYVRVNTFEAAMCYVHVYLLRITLEIVRNGGRSLQWLTTLPTEYTPMIREVFPEMFAE